MRKLEIADAGVMQLAIREEINRSEEARYDHRLHGLLLVSSGRSCNEIRRPLRRSGDDRSAVGSPVRRVRICWAA